MIKHKILLGVILTLIYEVCILMFEITDAFISPNHNFTCNLYLEYEELTNKERLQLDYRWLLLPQPVLAIALYVLFSSSIEFICAQSPYSMKGLLIGVLYIVYGLSISLSDGLSKLLQKALTKVGDKCHNNMVPCCFNWLCCCNDLHSSCHREILCI